MQQPIINEWKFFTELQTVAVWMVVLPVGCSGKSRKEGRKVGR